MLGYSIFNKSINGIKSISDGITIIENGIVTANDIKGQIKDKQNNLQIGTDLTIDSNLQVDNISTLNQVYVNGTDLNAFILAVDDILNNPDGTNPFLSNVIFAGTAEFGNTMILTNQNFSVWNGVDYTSFPMSNLNFISDMTGSTIQAQLNDKASKTTGTNTFNNFNIFNNYTEINDDLYCDTSVLLREIILIDHFGPGLSFLLSGPTLGKINYIKDLDRDIWILFNERPTFTYVDNSLALKADITYVDTEITNALSSISFSGTLTAPTSTDLTLTTTTSTNKVLISNKLEISGLSSSSEVLRVKGQSVFEQKVTFENNIILQNEQNPILTASYGSTVTFVNVKDIPKFCRVFGGITINLPTPPSSGLNNGYEITFIKYATSATCTINCTTGALYYDPDVSGQLTYAMTEFVIKFVAIQDAWYKI